MAGFPSDNLPATESSFRSFGHLFASPVCGLVDLAEEWTDEDKDAVGDDGASYDRAGWVHNSPGLTLERPSESFVLRATFLRFLSVGCRLGSLLLPLEVEL
jgi:hypothetical protein